MSGERTLHNTCSQSASHFSCQPGLPDRYMRPGIQEMSLILAYCTLFTCLVLYILVPIPAILFAIQNTRQYDGNSINYLCVRSGERSCRSRGIAVLRRASFSHSHDETPDPIQCSGSNRCAIAGSEGGGCCATLGDAVSNGRAQGKLNRMRSRTTMSQIVST